VSAAVFISHSSKDQKVAHTICNALEQRGLKCWIASRDVGPGANYMEAIVRAIRAAEVMVLVFTQNANGSDEILKELALASKYRVNVIPARTENVAPSCALELEFATRQWIDLFADWEHEIERLSAWIAKSLVPFDTSNQKNADDPASWQGACDTARSVPVDAGTTAGAAPKPAQPVATRAGKSRSLPAASIGGLVRLWAVAVRSG
jgi:hypothetical protein